MVARKADEGNAAPEIEVPATSEPKLVAGAADTKGAKLIRTNFRQDSFKVDDKTTINGDWQEFSASRAAELIALARRSGVDIVVTDKEN